MLDDNLDRRTTTLLGIAQIMDSEVFDAVLCERQVLLKVPAQVAGRNPPSSGEAARTGE